MVEHIRLVFPEENVIAVARLLEAQAPDTCGTIWEHLPFEGELIHGQWSGPEAYLLIDPSIRIGPENQTVHTLPGDVGYYSLAGGRLIDWPEDMAELAFIYGRGARPSMIDGPVKVNVFARIEENLEGFADTCRRLRTEGVKAFRVERLGK